MNDPRQITERILGRVDWQSDVSGFCKCPGEAMHTSQNGKRDCRVSVDGRLRFLFSCVMRDGGGGGESAVAPGAGGVALGTAVA